MAEFSDAREMLKSMGEYALGHPECEFVGEDDPVARQIGFSSGSETWTIGLTTLRKTVPSELQNFFTTPRSRLQVSALVRWLSFLESRSFFPAAPSSLQVISLVRWLKPL